MTPTKKNLFGSSAKMDSIRRLEAKREAIKKQPVKKTPGTISRSMLSDEQVKALEKMEDFIHSTDRQMVLAGYAGTGKSTITRMLLDYIDNETSIKAIGTAPTNEAVRVIANLSGREYTSTIYSLLGLTLVQDDDGPARLKVNGSSKLKDYELIIVDESSMINTDLFMMVESLLRQYSHIKLLYIGDPAQLPPVNDPNGISPVFLIDQTKWAFLSEVQRCTANNPIIQLVTLIRNNLNSQFDVFPHTTTYNEESQIGIEFITDHDVFMDKMYDLFCSDEFKADPNYVRALAYTNKAVNAMNSHIRKKIYGSKVPEYVENEIVLVDEPVIINKQIVYSAGERLRIHSIELIEDDLLGFKYWCLDVENYESQTCNRVRMDINVIHKNYKVKYKEALTSKSEKAKRDVIELGDKGKAWVPYFIFKNKFTSVKYMYALTTHKSQGSTFKNVFAVNVDFNTLRWNHVERNKLKYVAFTRASHRLVIY